MDRNSDTDEEMPVVMEEQMELDQATLESKLIDPDFWNDFGELLEEEVLT